MKNSTQSAQAIQPSMSRNLFDWVKYIVIPLLLKKLSTENAPADQSDDNPKDFGDMGAATENAETAYKKNKIVSLEQMLKHVQITDLENQEQKVALGSGVVIETGGNQFTIHLASCNFASELQGYINKKKVTFCSIASDLGKEILGKKVDESFNLKGAKITVIKIICPSAIEKIIKASLEIPMQVPAE